MRQERISANYPEADSQRAPQSSVRVEDIQLSAQDHAGLEVGFQSREAELAAKPRHLEAAERLRRIVDKVVYRNSPRNEIIGDMTCALEVFAVDIRLQPI